MAEVRALLFDFGNVIGFFDHHRGAAQVAAVLGGAATPERVYDFFFGTDLEDRYEKGLMSSEELLALLRSEFDAPDAPDYELARAFGSIFWRNDAVIEVIKRVPPSLPLLLGSNTNELHYRHFAVIFADVFERFRHQVLSFTTGRRKPDPEFFRLCIAAAGCTPERILFFDDKLENVDSARSVSIRGIVYTPELDLAGVLRENGVELFD